MLTLSTRLAANPGIELQPYDLGVLEAATRIRSTGSRISFCTLDSHLWPWARQARRDALQDLSDAATVWVYRDFMMDTPERPDLWPLVREGAVTRAC